MKIGFIGLGIMGSRMATNIIKKGHDLVVYTRTKDKARPLLNQGATWADNPADLAKESSIIITMLSKPEVVAEMALVNQHAFLAAAPEKALWIDCSTVNPSFSRLMASEAASHRVRFVDAPAIGSKGPAEQGQLLFFAGGNKADVEEAKPVLECMGKAVIHIGGHGSGSAMKMVNNIILGQAMVAFSEALSLGESFGLSKQTMFDALAASPAMAPFLVFKRKKFEDRDYSVKFPLQWMHKDLHLASDTAFEIRAALPAMNVVKEIYAMAMREDLAEKDFAAVYEVVSRKK